MRRALIALHDHAVHHDPGLQIAPNEPQHGLVSDSLAQAVHEYVVVDPVKELLKVHVHDGSVSRLHVLLRSTYRIERAPAGPKAVSPGKNTILHRTAAGFTPPDLGHRLHGFTAVSGDCLVALHGRERIAAWKSIADWRELVARLLIEHYDPAYRRSSTRNFAQLAEAKKLPIASANDAAFASAAAALLNREPVAV